MWIQLIFFIISLLNNVFGSHSKEPDSSRSTLQKIRDYTFATLAFPIGQFVGIVFWALWAIDRELVLPQKVDTWFPTYINHMMHTIVIPAQLLELCLLYHIYPKRIVGMASSIIFFLVYIIWILVVKYAGGIWVYPILSKLDVDPKLASTISIPLMAFLIGCSLIGGLLYVLGELLNHLFWKKIRRTITKKSQKSTIYKMNEKSV